MILKERKFWIDVVLGTAFVFFIMKGLGSVLGVFEFLDPVGDALSDMEITDQVFSQLREQPKADTNVVIVNIGNLDRRGIAEQIFKIRNMEPKVIGLDANFLDLKPDTVGDYALSAALSNADNIVVYGKLLEPDDDGVWHYLLESLPMFTQDNIVAHVNLNTDQAGVAQHQFKTCRSFFPMERYMNPETQEMEMVPAFGVQIASMYDKEKADKFLARQVDEEVINYRGNVFDLAQLDQKVLFTSLDVEDVLTLNFHPGLIKGKIVLFGFLGQSFSNMESHEDKYFTPLNEKYAGRANPDMYGVVIHANIISMILNEDYLDQMSETAGLIFAIIICFLNVALFQLIYRRLPRWYDGLTKLIQLFEAVIMLFVIVLFFHYFSIKLNLTVGIIAILLAGDSLEVYNGVLKNLFTKETRRQLFTIRKD